MTDRIIGILGGMGPEATLDLFREIIHLVPAREDQDHPRVLIYSNPKIPDRTRAMLQGGDDPLPELIETARRIERAGAGIIAMPCNTAHYFLDGLQRAVTIPIINMIAETYTALRSSMPEVTCAGLLAATGTVRAGLYAEIFEKGGVKILVPNANDQDRIHAAICNIKGGAIDGAARRTFESIGNSLAKRGAQVLILGCTEIPLAFDTEKAACPTLNPTRLLAQAAIDWALGRRE